MQSVRHASCMIDLPQSATLGVKRYPAGAVNSVIVKLSDEVLTADRNVDPDRWNARVRDRLYVGWCRACGSPAFGDLLDEWFGRRPGGVRWTAAYCGGQCLGEAAVVVRPRTAVAA